MKEKKHFNIYEVSMFRPATGWFIAKSTDEETVVGFSIIPPYGNIYVEAEYSEHARFGPQWKVDEIKYENIDEITLALLSSGIVAEIRESKAQAVFNKFGSKIWGILEASVNLQTYEFDGQTWEARDLLMTVKGIKKVVSNQMIESWRENRQIFITAINAIRCHMSVRQFRRIMMNGYSSAEFDMMVHNISPNSVYDLMRFGLTFEECDKLAVEEDWDDKPAISLTHPIRLGGAVKKVLHDYDKKGHMCAPVRSVENAVFDLIGIEKVFDVFKAESYGLRFWKEFVYELENWDVEQSIASFMVQYTDCKIYNYSDEQIQSHSDFPLTDEQIQAIRMILTRPLSIITGGPGTGKTSILKIAVEILEQELEEVTLCAFMGATARRMKLATGHDASTLHSELLLFEPQNQRPHLDNGVLFIDEVSTMSSDLFRDVVELLGKHVRLVLIGDADQLPPVGNGEVFLQLINSELIPVTRLTKIFRNGGVIAQACKDVNEGILPTPDNKNFFFVETNGDLHLRALKAYDYLLKQKHVKTIEVLAPLNVSRHKLNDILQHHYNEFGEPIPDSKIRVGDPVVQLENNKQLHVYNGMTGYCNARSELAEQYLSGNNKESFTDVSKEFAICGVEFEDEPEQTWHTNKTIHQLDLAYAITVHKSIGNQFDAVILVLPYLPEQMRLRQIVYTAMSRSKKMLIVVSAPHAMEACIKSEARIRRYSNLAEFMKGGMSE